MPTPTIPDGKLYFDIALWTGNNTNPRSISGLNFSPDFVWLKARSFSGQGNQIVDSVRGYGTSSMRTLITNQTVAEESDETNAGQNVAYGNIQSLNSNGFTIDSGAVNADQTNKLNETYVAWTWDANGAGSSNTEGSITSTVSANTTSGFSIATLTTPASGTFTVGHGLGVAPSLVIIKGRTTAGYTWNVYHRSAGAGGLLVLNSSNAFTANTGVWQNTNPTSTIVYGNSSNWGGSEPYVMYCWAPVDGFSRFGSYTGNGSTDGPFVYLGFRPKFVMFKRTDTAGDWNIRDTSRSPSNTVGQALYPNLNFAEYSGTETFLDLLSNGIKFRGNWNSSNASGGTYIYVAFAENPFKYANAR